ncbi:MAG: JAB domain-containing protein [Williamsia sp.]|nr:JAB domain-containing protein [Williamsia sp.]
MEYRNEYPAWTKVAEVELVYRTKIKSSDRPAVNSATDIAILMQNIWNKDRIEMQEEFKVLFLSRGNRVIGLYEVASGGITGTVADPRLILAAALKALAISIVLCHNHPSGNVKPSRADQELTAKIREAASYHDIKVLDHIILSSESFYSFADEGLL